MRILKLLMNMLRCLPTHFPQPTPYRKIILEIMVLLWVTISPFCTLDASMDDFHGVGCTPILKQLSPGIPL